MISLPSVFEKDIQSNTISITPLIIVDDSIYISSNKGIFKNKQNINVFYEDRNLQLSNISESVDVIEKRFKINNVNFKLNNFPVNGVRFSDFVSDTNLINKFVDIYYKTQSAQNIEDCILVYRGTIRRFVHDSKSCKISLEDITEDKLSQKIPYATNLSHDTYRLKDKNKPIPMCYGHVDRAPAILYFDTQTELSGKDYLKASVDDVFNTNRDISLDGFHADMFDYLLTQDQESENTYANIHPLFIYKDDYYRVLQNVDTSKIENLMEDGWDWAEYEQYKVYSDNITIEKKYNGSFPLNPPSNNEFQCIKVRYPKEIKMIPNPSEYSGDDTSEVDTNLLSVRFEQTGIKNPFFAIDNPIKELQSKYIVTSNHEATFASIPNFDDTMISMAEDLIYVDNFRPHNYESTATGVTNADNSYTNHEGFLYNYQWEVRSWLWRYAHHYNTDHYNPTISFIRMPNIKNVATDLAIKLEREFIVSVYEHYFPDKTSAEIEAGVNEVTSAGGYHDPSDIDINWWFHSSYHRHNTCYNISSGLAANWREQNELTHSLAHDLMYANSRFDLSFPDGYGGYNEDTFLLNIGAQLSNLPSGNDYKNYNSFRSYAYLCEQDAPEYGKPENGFIKHPTEVMQFTGHNTYQWIYFPDSWSNSLYYNQGVVEGYNSNGMVYRPNPLFNNTSFIGRQYGGWNSGFGYSHIIVGTESLCLNYENMTTGYVFEENSDANFTSNIYYNGKARYFNFFSPQALRLENSSHDFLYDNIDEFPIYSPVECTHKDHTFGYTLGLKYRAVWNGCDLSSSTGVGLGQSGNTGLYHDSGDQGAFAGWNDNEHSMSGSNNERNSGWHLWIREDIVGMGGSELTPTIIGESNINFNPKLIIPKNTILACQYRSANLANSGFTHGAHKFGLGEVTSQSPDFATLIEGEAGVEGSTEQRVGVVMPFADLDITDNIKCDTFFFGKINVEFNTDTSNILSTRFKLQVGAADFSLAENSEGNLDWGVWDDSLNDIISKNTFGISNVMFSTLPIDSNPDNSFNGNTFINDSLDERIAQFHDPSNYNSLVLQYKMENLIDVNNPLQFKSNIFSAGIIHYLQFEGVLDADIYMDAVGRVNNNDDYIIDDNNTFLSKYTNEIILTDSTGGYSNNPFLIERPCDIIYHVLEKELGLIDMMDLDGIEKARTANTSMSNIAAFSLNKQMKAKDFIQKLCTNSNILPLFKGTSKFSFASLSGEISEVDMEINSSDVIKYSFTRTPVEKIHTMVNVKYKKDYAEDEMLLQTGYVDGYDFFGNGDNFQRKQRGYTGFSYDYLGLDRTEKVFEFEADYIRDEEAAKQLRDYIFLWNCNQHNIFTLDLPIKYMNLEVGDIVSFTSLIENLKAYGEDYTTTVSRNEQTILPYFVVTSTNKKSKNISIKVMQLHKIEGNFEPHQGSISRSIGIKSGFDEESEGTLILMEDLEDLLDFINGNAQFYTEKQKKVSDILQDGYIGMNDYNTLIDSLGVDNFLLGDLNLDAAVNVVDVVQLVNQILQSQDTENALEIADYNSDGILNVVDIVAMVNEILGTNN
tara:strand:- start:1080 stop:5732 length:4653 start_codon:yes stop_codon:yes gene_type:complete